MVRARADCTSMAKSRFLRRIGAPDVAPSVVVKRPAKAAGSRELILGRWHEVTEAISATE